MKLTGLYFGSFNPIHTGHLMVAQSFYNTGFFNKIIFVVSPQNPFKTQTDLLPEQKRLHWVKQAVADNNAFEVSDIEFNLPKPGYTIDTLNTLLQSGIESPAILMGGDNLEGIMKWKNIEELAAKVQFFVYGRNENVNNKIPFEIHYHKAPFIAISGTYIREAGARGASLKYLVSDAILYEVSKEIMAFGNHE